MAPTSESARHVIVLGVPVRRADADAVPRFIEPIAPLNIPRHARPSVCLAPHPACARVTDGNAAATSDRQHYTDLPPLDLRKLGKVRQVCVLPR